MRGSDKTASKPSHGTNVKPASQTSGADAEDIDTMLEHAKAAGRGLFTHEATPLQMRCGSGMQALRARIPQASRPGTDAPMSQTHERAVLLSGQYPCGFEDVVPGVGSYLDPHSMDSLKALLIAQAKSGIVSCAYDSMRGYRPPYNTFTPDLRHFKPNDKLGKLLGRLGGSAGELPARAELPTWIKADREPGSTIVPDYLPQKQQLHEWAIMPEADADALGAALSSLALELISLMVENVSKTPEPPKALFDTSNAAQSL